MYPGCLLAFFLSSQMLSIPSAPPIPTSHVQRKLPVFNHLSSLINHIARSWVVSGGGGGLVGRLTGWLHHHKPGVLGILFAPGRCSGAEPGTPATGDVALLFAADAPPPPDFAFLGS